MLPSNESPSGKHTARSSGVRPRTLILVGLFAGICGGLIGAFATYSILREQLPADVVSGTLPTHEQTLINLQVDSAITDVVESVGPAVVTVINHLPSQRTFFGNVVERTSTGSGVITSNDGYIVTNNHVVEGTQSLEVILSDGESLQADLIGVDLYSDLAVLQVEGEIPKAAAWGNSDLLRPGETVVAIGSPLGDFTNTVTLGVVSAMERTIEIDEEYFLEGMIQTDAAINQGNSGGPLLNAAGQVIGINTLIVRGSGSAVTEGLGFAIPSNTARAISDQLIAEGFFARPYPGIRWVNVTPSLASRYRLPTDYGIFITEIDPLGPADEAGLQRGDIITSVNDEAINEDHPFRNLLFQYQPGDRVTFTYLRGNVELQVLLELGAMR
jgi:serine protease Do